MPHDTNHIVECRKNASKDLIFDGKTRMTPLQTKAMLYMHTKSEKEHNSVKHALQQRVKKLGFTI